MESPFSSSGSRRDRCEARAPSTGWRGSRSTNRFVRGGRREQEQSVGTLLRDRSGANPRTASEPLKDTGASTGEFEGGSWPRVAGVQVGKPADPLNRNREFEGGSCQASRSSIRAREG